MKEWAALILLLLLLAAALVNVVYLDRLISEIEGELEAADLAAAEGNFREAESRLDAAVSRWTAADSYTHIFLRHPEIDAASDAFFELKQLLAEENAEGYPSALEKLIYHLQSIDEMEHVRLGSVL